MKYREVETLVLAIINEENNIEQAMERFFTSIQSNEINDVCRMLGKLDYKKDFSIIKKSIIDILTTNKPAIKIKAFWIGIFESSVDGKEFYQSYLSATNIFSTNEESDWAVNPNYFPENRFIKSEILIICHKLEIISNKRLEIQYFPLWYLSLVIGILVKLEYKMFLINTVKCNICVGFDEGDYNHIGFIDNNGLTCTKIIIPKPTKLKKTKSNSEYYILKDSMKGAWHLNITNTKGEMLVCGAFRLSKVLEYNELIASINDSVDGIAVDYWEGNDGPVVSEKFMNIILNHVSSKDVQFIPIRIIGYDEGRYFGMNVLKQIQCLNFGETIFYTNRYYKDLAINVNLTNGCQIFRLNDDVINHDTIISKKLKEELESNQVTGTKIIGIRLT